MCRLHELLLLLEHDARMPGCILGSDGCRCSAKSNKLTKCILNRKQALPCYDSQSLHGRLSRRQPYSAYAAAGNCCSSCSCCCCPVAATPAGMPRRRVPAVAVALSVIAAWMLAGLLVLSPPSCDVVAAWAALHCLNQPLDAINKPLACVC